MSSKAVTVRAPSSIANLGFFFDFAGMAVAHSYDTVTARLLSEGVMRVEVRARGAPQGQRNVAYHAAVALLEDLGEMIEVLIEVEKGVPIGYGLGSSGATAAATVVALNTLLGDVLSSGELVRYAGAGEAYAAGAPHYDNVAASIMGGIALVCSSGDQPLIVRLEPPRDYSILVFTPKKQLLSPERKTEAMRRILPDKTPLQRVVEAMRNTAAFLHYAGQGEWAKAFRIMNNGWEVEEARSRLIPGYREAKEAALRAGALAFNIAGAGPSLFAVARSGEEEPVLEAVKTVLEPRWQGLEARIVAVDTDGAKIL